MSSYIEDVLKDAFIDRVGVRKKESHSDKPKKSQSITFRLDSNTLDELQREADHIWLLRNSWQIYTCRQVPNIPDI